MWAMPGRHGVNSSVAEYVALAEELLNISASEDMGVGDVFFTGIHPYDIFQRPLASVEVCTCTVFTTG